MEINGVTHIKDNSFNYYSAQKISEFGQHPLGTVYYLKGWGYVANGYNWYKFPINKLKQISDQ